ncbi:hypothetical protein [Microcoleus sp. bin38.metabat.b11b12b14.051]|uniref:hypothetical protein n=1 Tax=Microcoleus sp. bin38.metabat.b11b12b14.051 TaxID=2742709 RepID=UPI0025D483F5|nr:hypothetical protein [Microcoleus sp. bin38.metabat.b11b12b14.051]
MYDKRPDRDWATAAVTAALGAGVVTSFAVSRGQNPLVALEITVFATGVALLPTFRYYNSSGLNNPPNFAVDNCQKLGKKPSLKETRGSRRKAMAKSNLECTDTFSTIKRI